MEMACQLQRPLGCKVATMDCSRLRIRPTIGVLNSLESNDLAIARTVAPMRASSDNSRKRPRKSAIPRTNVSAPKGFAPRPQVGRSTQKKDRDPDEEEQSGSSQSIKSRTKLSDDGEARGQVDADLELVEKLYSNEDERDEIGTMMLEETIVYDDENFEKGRVRNDESLQQEKISEFSGNSCLGASKVQGQMEKLVITENHKAAGYNKKVGVAMVEDDASIGQYDGQSELYDVSSTEKKVEMEAQARRKFLEGLANENFASGIKFFVFPKVIKADQMIEVFFNRALSLLANEPDVFISGAFNNWRWKNFTEKMRRSDLNGDWWSCQIYVPKEAYKMDFVFFNGGNVYENNNLNDFSKPVEGEMDEYAFEDLLLEEQRRGLEKIAAEQAEKERVVEEQRRREVERDVMDTIRTQAKFEVKKMQEACQRVMTSAVESVDGLWHIEHSLFKGKNVIRLFYNRKSRALEHSSNIWIHGGYNNWIEGLSIIERLNKSEKYDGWWYVDVVLPDGALILDWVFADGPPQQAKVYDNNSYQDFHAVIPKGLSEKEIFWLEEEDRIFKKLWEERRLKEEAARKKAEKTARLKAETKERTFKRFLLSQKHVVYTEPLYIQAGKMVRVLYNPFNTVLNGKEEVWFKCSFNRWTHPNGPLPPQKMVNVGTGPHLQAIVEVPLDAYIMDFVFSEREDGGVYDNKNGMDYHFPVTGGISKVEPLHIIHVAVEMAPIAKVGGLGDVVTSLSRAVQDLGHKVDIVLPKYDCLKFDHVKDFCYHVSFGWGGTEIKVWRGKVEGLSVYFLEPQNRMFDVGCIYGRNNDRDRFGFFCHAALEFLHHSGFCPDILHCHDWSSAPVAWLFKEHYYKQSGLGSTGVIFTIHNLEFGAHQIGKAMSYTDKATTVSHTYAKEVSRNPVISAHLYKFHGIVNGIDPDLWDPYNDNFIPVSYTSENVIVGRKAAKEALQQRLGLKNSNHPLVGIITRLTVQKGIHLIKHAIWRTLESNGQIVLLGSAPDPRIQQDFVNLANQLHSSHSGNVRLCLTYDEPLSHLIYAAADFILVPSIFEPCGLTQLIAMRYGSIPVVRKTGGLYDTVFDVDDDKERAQSLGLEPNGFSFDGTDSSGVDYALNRALSAWYHRREWFELLCKRVMEQDWSWNRPALDYIELYYAARK
ncbi:LOW QUALITY PROTEIN: starch synthase 3, chloroplastic/amyloplastic [Phalaenopsis equestris]|uniref:LOW QUALITY PROTEIN: starch synthase 3, chloroplastic/amyloplastic n=1 Tax=Phalaenopsis equestris TaxID=78828 RepID=UPI0009E2A15D|nr:LOW QUALITY PROTEIN: starch synthase 3, chloroplastic/amyloplastic [Phalaenopsis equestris]